MEPLKYIMIDRSRSVSVSIRGITANVYTTPARFIQASDVVITTLLSVVCDKHLDPNHVNGLFMHDGATLNKTLKNILCNVVVSMGLYASLNIIPTTDLLWLMYLMPLVFNRQDRLIYYQQFYYQAYYLILGLGSLAQSH